MSEDAIKKIKDTVARKVIEHQVTFPDKIGEEKEISQDEAQIMKNQLATMALKAFQDKKNEAIDRLGVEFSDDIEDCQSGPEFDRMVSLLEKIKSPTKSKSPPAGKVKGIIPQGFGGEGFDSFRDVVESTYDTLEEQLDLRRRGSKDFDAKVLKEAQRNVDKLWNTAINSEKLAMQGRGKATKWRIWRCSCGTDNVTETCSECNKRSAGFRLTPTSRDVPNQRTVVR